MTTYYKQCRMRRGDGETVAWIEERGATVGASVELKTADGAFWEVVEVYPHRLTEEQLRDKQQRDRDSLPSIGTQR